MKTKLFSLAIITIMCMHPISGECQNLELSTGAWNKSVKNNKQSEAIEKGLKAALENALRDMSPHKKESSTKRRAEEERLRKEAEERQNKRIEMQNSPNIINYFCDDDYKDILLSDIDLKNKLVKNLSESNDILSYMKIDKDLRSLILSNSLLINNVKNQLLNVDEKILDYLNDPDLKRIITSDRELNEYCENMKMRVAIKNNPQKVLSYLGDPKAEERIKNDEVLLKGFKDGCYERVTNNMKAKKEAKRRQLEAEKRREIAKRIEEQRIREESKRAKQQAEENEAKRLHNEELSNRLLAMSPEGRPIARTNDSKKGGSLISQDIYNELLEDPLVVNNTSYRTSATMANAWGNPRVKSSTELKEKENKNKGNTTAISVGVDLALDKIPFPKTVKAGITARAIAKEELPLVERSLKCIKNEGLKAASTLNKRNVEEFWNKCVVGNFHQSEEKFNDIVYSSLGITAIRYGQKLANWLTNKKANGDEEE